MRFFEYIIYLLFIIFNFNYSFAQNPKGDGRGKISGKVIDSATGEPVFYATVVLFPASGTQPVDGTSTDSLGNFKLVHVPNGSYKIELSFIGYGAHTINNITISENAQTIKLGNQYISPKTWVFKDVVVKGNKSPLEFKSDRIVFNVEKDLTSQGGTSLDVLKKIPDVSVDVDGNVQVQGNPGVRFLINGKPSSLFGNSLPDALQAIPASQIKSIELITIPGAMYDGASTGGIINIILKDNKLEGVNGSVNLTAGTRLENGSVNLNVKKGKFNVSLFGSGNGSLMYVTNTNSLRTATDSSTGYGNYFRQTSGTQATRYGGFSGLSVNWAPSKHNDITFNMNESFGNYESKANIAQNSTLLSKSGITLADSNTIAPYLNHSRFNSTDLGLSYRHSFHQEKQDLTMSVTSSFGNNWSYYRQSQESALGVPYSGTLGTNPGTDNYTEVKADYTQPLGKEASLEMGSKMDVEHIGSPVTTNTLNTTDKIYELNPALSYALQFDRTIYAGYISANYKLFHFLQLKTGLRYERTDNSGSFSTSLPVTIPSYDTWLPSINIAHAFNKTSLIKIAYTRRLERPDFREINPFVSAADPHNISMGNPSLLPEIADKFEMGYNTYFKHDISLYVSVYYMTDFQDIKPVVTYHDSFSVNNTTFKNVSVSTRANIGTEKKPGTSINLSVPLGNAITIRYNLSLFERYVITNSASNSLVANTHINSFEYRTNINISWKVSKTLIAEGFANYNSGRTILQATYNAYFTYNFAFRKTLFHEKGSLGLVCNNPFAEYVKQTTNLTYPNLTQYSERNVPYSSYGVNFIYRFGKVSEKKKQEQVNQPDNSLEQ